jgi:hypothetical protein
MARRRQRLSRNLNSVLARGSSNHTARPFTEEVRRCAQVGEGKRIIVRTLAGTVGHCQQVADSESNGPSFTKRRRKRTRTPRACVVALRRQAALQSLHSSTYSRLGKRLFQRRRGRGLARAPSSAPFSMRRRWCSVIPRSLRPARCASAGDRGQPSPSRRRAGARRAHHTGRGASSTVE